MSNSATYREAGVDIDKANLFVDRIKPVVRNTFRKEVMSGIGGFGALFRMDLARWRKPILVSSTDGVGTKLRVAHWMNRHDTIGIDLVAMSVNDVLVQGAEPLFFLDYLATGRIDVETSVKVVEGIARGCQDAGCALIGGETAEMPGFYGDGEYDLAGFCVGVVEEDRLIDGSEVRVGDVLIGIASTGLHSNGYSLARKVFFDRQGLSVQDRVAGLEGTVGEELLKPTRIYVKSVLNVLKNFSVHGLVHVTGGGFYDNIPRIVRGSIRAVVRRDSWIIPPVFRVLQELGRVEEGEMFRVFNMGIGMILVVPEQDAPEILNRLHQLGETAWPIGHIDRREDDQPPLEMVSP